MSSLIPFEFETKTIRVIQDEQGEPWFVAADVCAVLGITTEQTRRLDDDEKGLHSTQTPSGNQQMVVINESGLYSLILGSRKPEAKKFKKWITAEVIPAIRKTGTYSVPSQTNATGLLAQAMQMIEAEHRARLDAHDLQLALQGQKVTLLDKHVTTLVKVITSRRQPPVLNANQIGLDLNSPAKTRREYQGGTHASPRDHQRREHYRTLPNGKRIRVKAHLVRQNKKGETLQ